MQRQSFGLVLLAGLLSMVFSCGDRPSPKRGGAPLAVLFDERHDLEGGEPVRFHDFEVGTVEKVDLAEARVRATLSIDPEVLSQLTKETTVSVASDDGSRYLVIHVLDPEAEKLAPGATLDGVDSALELTYRRVSAEANDWLERFGSSEWRQDADDLLSRMERAVSETDWNGKRDEIERQLGEARREIERMAGESADAARERYEGLRQELGRIVKELEEAGHSEEAKKLREKVSELFDEDEKPNKDKNESKGRVQEKQP